MVRLGRCSLPAELLRGLTRCLDGSPKFWDPSRDDTVAGIPELVENNVTGLTVPPGRSDALADALIQIGGSAMLRTTLGRNGQARVRLQHDADSNVAALMAMFAASPSAVRPGGRG